MNKKGFSFALVIVALAMILIAIILMIIFSNRISPVTTPIFDFLTKWWWTFLVITALIVFAPLIRRVAG